MIRRVMISILCLPAASLRPGGMPPRSHLPIVSRRQTFAAAAAAAVLGGARVAPAFAERNVVTKQEAAEMKSSMVSRYDEPTECDAACLAAQEERRKKRQAVLAKKAAFENKVAAIEAAKKGDDFVTAAIDFEAYLTVTKEVPEGVKVKDLVKRLRAAYGALPQKRIECDKDVRPGTKCSSPGASVEKAYEGMIIMVRKSAGCATLDCKGSATEAF
jgi:hypothetical protein